jgi:hypothetical protein
VIYPAGDPALKDELRRLRTALPKHVALLVGGAASSAYGAVLDEIGAIRPNDLAQLRAHLQTLGRSLRRRRRFAVSS